MEESELFENGMKIRRAVLGEEYVSKSMANADDFMLPMQRMATEIAWGYTWARPGLSRRERSLITIAMLTALHLPSEVKLHVLGALNNGITPEEIQEVLIQAAAYCGVPAGLEAFKAAHEVLKAEGAL